MTSRDCKLLPAYQEFATYLLLLSDEQVRKVYQLQRKNRRWGYANLAMRELDKRKAARNKPIADVLYQVQPK